MDALAELEALIGSMGDAERADLDRLIATELKKRWLPNPGPQSDAYHSEADLLLYGGAAGGGKSSLIVGLTVSNHQRVAIFRRSYGELSDIAETFLETLGSRDGWNGQDMRFRKAGKVVEFGALEKPGSEKAWRGRAHDLLCFDEGAELSQEKIAFVMGWLRSTDPNQRCRTVIASNPPTGGEGDWLIRWFAPWLDPLSSHAAAPGELRWCAQVGDETVWADGPGVTVIEDESYTHQSRTFIPAFLDDNPYLRDTNYRSRLQALTEPLRSQLLKGDFLAGREDHEWQVIPSEWVRLANERWSKAPLKRRAMITLAMDVAGGGPDDSALAALHADCWFAPVQIKKSADIQNAAQIPAELAAWMLKSQRDGADLSVDGTGGWGSGVRSHLITNHGMECASIVFSAGSNRKTADGKLGFKNLRADMYWKFREALDPDTGDEVMLPPDTRLTAELTVARYAIRGTDIKIEDKDEIKKRVGSSPDRADAVVMAWHRRKAAALAASRKSGPAAPALVGGWMAR